MMSARVLPVGRRITEDYVFLCKSGELWSPMDE